MWSLRRTRKLENHIIEVRKRDLKTGRSIVREQNEAAMDFDSESPPGTHNFSQEECTADRDWQRVVVPESFEPRPAPWMLLEQLWKKQRTLRSSGITFATCSKSSLEELEKPACQKMLDELGLLEFSKVQLPEFDQDLCTAFISSYAHPYTYGIVEGRAVNVSVQQISKLTRLPVGNWKLDDYNMGGRNKAVLQGILRTLKQKKPGLYSLESVRFGDVEESKAFKEIARLLMERFICKPHPADSVMHQIVLSMHGSLRHRMKMKWAQVLTTRISKAAYYSRVVGNTPFCYGEWLTGLIRQQLSLDEWEVNVSGNSELETSLRDLAKMEIDRVVLDYRIGADGQPSSK